MEFSNELCTEIVALKRQSVNSDQDSFLMLVKKIAQDYGVTYTVLLKMIYDRDFLFSQLNPEMERLENQIESITEEINYLTEQVSLLQQHRNFVGSTICQVYGHSLEANKEGNALKCSMCGIEMPLEYDNTLEANLKGR